MYEISGPRNIQTALREAGFYNGAIDSRIGPRTKNAVKDFQKANGLQADGVVGQKTWQKLNQYLEPAPNSDAGFSQGIPVEKSPNDLNRLESELAGLKRENAAYREQIKSISDGSLKKDKELVQLKQQITAERRTYQKQLSRSQKQIRDLRIEYEKRLKKINGEVEKLRDDKLSLLEENIEIEGQKDSYAQRLHSIKKHLEMAIEIYS